MAGNNSKDWCFEQHKTKLVAVFGLAPDASVADFYRRLKKLSSFEKGVVLARALDEGYWPSVRKMAEDLHDWFTMLRLNDLVALGRLPSSFVSAFERPESIRIAWSRHLRHALYKDPDIVLSRAGTIKQERLAGHEWPAKRVYEALTGKDGV